MKANSFYEATLGRTNVLKTTILGFFFSITSYFRLLLEVHIRKGFGSGYFSLASAITVLVPLAVFPVIFARYQFYFGIGSFIAKFLTWYIFLGIFAYRSWQHHIASRRKPGEYDFTKYSKFGGYQDYRFHQIKVFGRKLTTREVATIFEPGLFLLIGLGLMLLRQPIGVVITISSIVYSLGYRGAYHIGDMYIQDIIDKMILAEELQETCVNGKYPDADKGFELFDMPINPEYRRKMANFASGRDEPLAAY